MDLMVKHGVSGLPVVDADDRLVGVVSEYDLLILLCDCDEIESDLVQDYMTTDVRHVGTDADWKELAETFRVSRLRRLPVTEDGKVVGIVSRHDLVRELLKTRTPTTSKPALRTSARPSIQLDCHALLVEDGRANTRFLTHVLKKTGARVTLAEHGRSAVEMVEKTLSDSPPIDDQSEPFDIILMDMDMPVMDGYEATGRIREMGFEGPIIAVTGRTDKYDRQRCLDAGCNDYLSKPYDRTKLLKMISQHIEASEQGSKDTGDETRIEEQPVLAASPD
jgi:CheY-like chemotaxis protein